jgi:hypothetical protein
MLVITGPMRSGTSMLARMAQQIGIDMGRTMMIPACGLDAEYEDAELVMRLTEWVVEESVPRDVGRQIWQYMKLRQERFDRDTKVRKDLESWGVKSPFLALFLPEIAEAAQHINEPLHLVVAMRSMDDTDVSMQHAMRRHLKPIPWSRVMRRLRTVQGEIQRGLEDTEALKIPFDFMRQFPQSTVTRIANLVGIEDVDYGLAIRGIESRQCIGAVA